MLKVEAILSLVFVLAILGLVAAVFAWNHPSLHVEPVPDVVVIDGCQYFKLDVGPRYYYTLTHKGNCTNH